jgi:hypothetical protein
MVYQFLSDEELNSAFAEMRAIAGGLVDGVEMESGQLGESWGGQALPGLRNVLLLRNPQLRDSLCLFYLLCFIFKGQKMRQHSDSSRFHDGGEVDK